MRQSTSTTPPSSNSKVRYGESNACCIGAARVLSCQGAQAASTSETISWQFRQRCKVNTKLVGSAHTLGHKDRCCKAKPDKNLRDCEIRKKALTKLTRLFASFSLSNKLSLFLRTLRPAPLPPRGETQREAPPLKDPKTLSFSLSLSPLSSLSLSLSSLFSLFALARSLRKCLTLHFRRAQLAAMSGRLGDHTIACAIYTQSLAKAVHCLAVLCSVLHCLQCFALLRTAERMGRASGKVGTKACREGAFSHLHHNCRSLA